MASTHPPPTQPEAETAPRPLPGALPHTGARPPAARPVAEASRHTGARRPDEAAVRPRDDEVSLRGSALRDRGDALAGGLASLGVRRGDTVALLLGNRPEFHVADLAAMTLGATP